MARRGIKQRTIVGALMALMATPVAAEVVVVVADDSTVESLTAQQLADIYLGRRDLLPNGYRVEPIDHREKSLTYREFYAEYLDRTPAQIKSYWSRLVFTGRGRPPRTAPNGQAMADSVASNRHVIGYLDPALVDDRLRVVSVEGR